MAAEREKIPAGVERQLRQESGFGCCRCGYPFTVFHHVVPWAIEQHFRPADMIAVCPNCHDEIENGKVSELEQRAWKAKPFNIQQGFAQGLLRVDNGPVKVNFGGNYFEDTPIILQLYDEPILVVYKRNDQLLVSLTSYDHEDNLIFKISNNDWITGGDLPWDLGAKWRHITLRSALRKISLEVDARVSPIKIRGSFWKNGVLWEADDRQIKGANGTVLMKGNRFINCGGGISFGYAPF